MRTFAALTAFFAVIALAAAGSAAQSGAKGSVTGRVVDARGKAIAGARVTATGPSDATATTDAKGEFRIELEPGEYRLQFDAEGHATAAMREPVTVEAGKATKLKRRVQLPASDEQSVVRGSVFNGVGIAIPDATVTIERIPGEGGASAGEFRRQAVSDSMGLFAFRVPAGGGRFKLTATHDRYATTSVTVDLSGGEILNAPPLTMEPKR
jgi:hypothetical protein